MIDLYTWPTPNGQKVTILLEELGEAYRVNAIDIGAGDQFGAAFLEISPNNKIPAIVDPIGPDGEPFAIFESGAILMYLARKHERFWDGAGAKSYETLKWLMWQMSSFGPMLGQTGHFRNYAPEKIPYAIDRYTNETGRLYRVLDKRLGEAAYLDGSGYSIADIATFPWTRLISDHGHELSDYPNVRRWFEEIDARPGVRRGLAVLQERRKPMTDEDKLNLFGSAQYGTR